MRESHPRSRSGGVLRVQRGHFGDAQAGVARGICTTVAAALNIRYGVIIPQLTTAISKEFFPAVGIIEQEEVDESTATPVHLGATAQPIERRRERIRTGGGGGREHLSRLLPIPGSRVPIVILPRLENVSRPESCSTVSRAGDQSIPSTFSPGFSSLIRTFRQRTWKGPSPLAIP